MLTTLLLALTMAPVPAPPVQQPSEKDLFDAALARLKPAQAEDGRYGPDLASTVDAVLGFELSPRSYRVDDGPFLERALTWLRAHRDEAVGDVVEARLALAFAFAHPFRFHPEASAILSRHGWTLGTALGLAVGGVPPELTPSAVLMAPEPSPEEALQRFSAVHPGLRLEDAPVVALAARVARAGLLRLQRDGLGLAPVDAPSRGEVDAAYDRGVAFLLAARAPEGWWEAFGQPEPGISAIAALALLRSGDPEARAAAQPTLDWLVSLQEDDGSIHAGRVQVYTTSVAVGALVAADDPKYADAIARARAFLEGVQVDEGEGYDPDHKFYGGIGYGGDLRPDLSNLQYAMEALHQAGAGPDDPAFRRAMRFLQRVQNRSESNPETYYDQGDPRPVRAGNDGGAVYYPGNSPAGYDLLPDGTRVARSYGSMTYALVKCYVFAGLPLDDPRLAAAVGWIQSHWTLEVNPGFDLVRDPKSGAQGLFYYYETVAEALDAAGLLWVTDTAGVRHDWRAELTAELLRRQRDDGSWVNEDAPRWWEGNPVLCTGYALSALHAAAGTGER